MARNPVPAARRAARRTAHLGAGLGAGLVVALAAGPAQAQEPRPMPEDLEALRWEARPVLIFADTPADPDYQGQLEALEKAAEGLAARDMVVLVDADPAAGGALRERLEVQGFAAVLIGKDGGVKLREPHPVAPLELFALVDRMPMRRHEMQAD